MNDNVQHRSEEWFQSPEIAIEYLRSRTEIFWKTTEQIWNLNTPKLCEGEHNSFNIIVPFYNASPWIQKCVKSVKSQNYSNYRCFLIDDMSTDNSIDLIDKEIQGDQRFIIIKNTNKKYALQNIADTIHEYGKANDINIILDGDDWFASYNVLSYLNHLYLNKDCLLTYGNYVYYPHGHHGVEPSEYPSKIIQDNNFRQDTWRASHLRTFMTKVWNKIDQKDLKDEEGQYYKTAYDQAIMLPMLEICGFRSNFVDKTMCVYNRANPLNVDKVKQQLQYTTAQKIRSKSKYRRQY